MSNFEEILEQQFNEAEIDEVYEEIFPKNDIGIKYSKARQRIFNMIPYFSKNMERFDRHCKLENIARINSIDKLKNIKRNNLILTVASYGTVPLLFAFLLTGDSRYAYTFLAMAPIEIYVNWRGELRGQTATIKLKLLEKRARGYEK